MKRYLLFWGNTYYPVGGMEDFVASYHTLEEAEQHADKIKSEGMDCRWGHIYDGNNMMMVREYTRD